MPQLRGHEGDEVILSGFASHLDEPFRSVSIAWQRRLVCARVGYSPRCFLSVASRGAGGPGLFLEDQQPPTESSAPWQRRLEREGDTLFPEKPIECFISRCGSQRKGRALTKRCPFT